MTYFFLFSITILAMVVFLSTVRVGVMEERIAILQHEVRQVRIQAEKKGRVTTPTHIDLWHNVRDFADGEVDYD